MLTIHGADDPTVNPDHADALMRQMLTFSGDINAGDVLPAGKSARRQLGANRYLTTTDYGPHRDIRIDDLGHAWSGRDAGGAPYFDPSAPDAPLWHLHTIPINSPPGLQVSIVVAEQTHFHAG